MGGLADGAKGPEVTSGDRLALLWRRVKEHRIAQWTVGYVAVAYGIQHAVTLTGEALDWPHAVTRVSFLLLALGLPVAMTLAWYHGERVSRRVSGGEMMIVSVLLVLTSLVFYAVVRPASETRPIASAVQEASVAAARAAAANPRLGIAVAVMPFANLSGDKDQEYFSDGMTDEISGALAKIPDLSVVARSSAYEFKGKNQNARTIGQQLHATHLIEGSVRKAGDQLRISAELIKADDGVTIWSDSYDRQLKDVFAIQEDIARAIATSLHMTLGLKPGENLVNERKIDADSYGNYLRAKGLSRTFQAEPTSEAIRLLEGVVERDPGYAPAWAALGLAHHRTVVAYTNQNGSAPEREKAFVAEHLPKAQAAAQQAVKLDPNSAAGTCQLAQIEGDRGNWVSAIDLNQRALALDPDDPDCLQTFSFVLVDLGFLKQALPLMKRALDLEPFVPLFQGNTARLLFISGQIEAAMSTAPGANKQILALNYATQGRYRDAADSLSAINIAGFSPEFAKSLTTAIRFLRSAPAAAPQNDRPELGLLDWVYIFAGAPERFMNLYENQLRLGFRSGGARGWQWAPAFHAIRQTERFKKWVRDDGLLAYWRAKGWPDLCHPTTGPSPAEAQGAKTGDDFECE